MQTTLTMLRLVNTRVRADVLSTCAIAHLFLSPSLSLTPMQCSSGLLPRQLTRSILQHGRYSIRRSFSTSWALSDSIKPPEAIIDSPSSRVFLSSPLREGNGNHNGDSSRKYIQANVVAITKDGPASDDFKIERLHDKLKKVELCKRYNLQPRDVS